jgi:hypothetical protein
VIAAAALGWIEWKNGKGQTLDEVYQCAGRLLKAE